MTAALILLFYRYDGFGDGVLLSGISCHRHWSTAEYHCLLEVCLSAHGIDINIGWCRALS